MTDAVACLHVCTTCRAGLPLPPDGVPMGAELYAVLAGLLAEAGAPVELRSVECLATCERGCTATISMPGKWSYLLGGLTPDVAADLLIYARSYAASKTGTIMPSRRPHSLKDMILARFPAHDIGTNLKQAAE
jgi:predicted metal-binding protein